MSTDLELLNLTPETSPPKRHRAKGKIPNLPKHQRDLINQMLDDGATYKVVAEEMDKHGVSLNGENISNWFNGPYQDYLRDQDWRADLRSLRESAADLDELSAGHQFQETVIQLALTEIFRALKHGQVKNDSPNYIRLFNALARLNREALGLRKYNDLRAKDQTEQLQKLDPNRDLVEKERGLLVAAMERAFGCKAAPGPIGPDLNEYIENSRRSRGDEAQTSVLQSLRDCVKSLNGGLAGRSICHELPQGSGSLPNPAASPLLGGLRACRGTGSLHRCVR
jgi:hypothetical protein